MVEAIAMVVIILLMTLEQSEMKFMMVEYITPYLVLTMEVIVLNATIIFAITTVRTVMLITITILRILFTVIDTKVSKFPKLEMDIVMVVNII